MCLSQLHLLLWWSNLLKLWKNIKWGWFLSPWNKVERFCRSWQRLNWFANDFLWGYKIKISPSILINKKCHSHHWFLTSKYECELPNCNPAVLPPPMVIAEKLEECKKQGEQGNRTGPRRLKCIWEEWVQWAQRPHIPIHQFSPSVVSDSVDCGKPGFPVHCQLLEHAQTHAHQVSDVFNLSYRKGLFAIKWWDQMPWS